MTPTPLAIAQLGQPVLRRPAVPLDPNRLTDPPFRAALAALRETLAQTKGVGLAAPQVFAGARLFLARLADRSATDAPVEAVINPVLLTVGSPTELGWEGCLSFPELIVQVPRYAEVRLEFLDEQGRPQARELSGFAARVAQHEYDHLDGVLTLDRAPSVKAIMKLSEWEKLYGKEKEAPPADVLAPFVAPQAGSGPSQPAGPAALL